MAQQPDLLPGMPVGSSLLADPSLAATQGEDMVTYYRLIADMLRSPNVVVFPELFASSSELTSAHIEQMWINNAINHYVMQHNVDLEAELANVATLISAYRECVAQIQPFEPATEVNLDRYSAEVLNCTFFVDPDMQTHMH